MAKKSALPESKIEWIETARLRFDARNPRLIEFLESNENPTQDELMQVLWEEMAIDELVMSIAESGYVAYEPLIVAEESGELVVIEGNRRLAAVRWLIDPALRKTFPSDTLPTVNAASGEALRKLPVILTSREDAWRYLGAKHVNGAKRWESYAKAQYVAMVMETRRIPLDKIAEQIGDSNKTVQRLYRTLKVIQQAEDAKVFSRAQRSKKKFAFTHLLTALEYPPVAEFIGLKDSYDAAKPVDSKKVKQLGEFCLWLYGDMNNAPVIRSQNPDLRRLAEVLRSSEGVDALRAGLSLDIAVDISLGDDRVFQTALLKAKDYLQTARAKASTGFKGDRDQLRIANDIADLAADLASELERKAHASRRTRTHVGK